MGTRHLTCVVLDGEYKVAQYGQWDGYPEGQGLTVLQFLKTQNLDEFKERLNKVRFLDPEGVDKSFCKGYYRNAPQWSSEPDKRTPGQKEWFETFINRDIGAKILYNIMESEGSMVLSDDLSFAGNSLFCEWCYVVNLDERVLEVYRGFNNEEIDESERFYGFYTAHEKYKQVKHLKSFSFDELPSEEEFVSALTPDEDEG